MRGAGVKMGVPSTGCSCPRLVLLARGWELGAGQEVLLARAGMARRAAGGAGMCGVPCAAGSHHPRGWQRSLGGCSVPAAWQCPAAPSGLGGLPCLAVSPMPPMQVLLSLPLCAPALNNSEHPPTCAALASGHRLATLASPASCWDWPGLSLCLGWDRRGLRSCPGCRG